MPVKLKYWGRIIAKNFEEVKEDIGVVLDESYFPEVITAKQLTKL